MQQYRDWIVGVILKPAETFRDIYEKKPIWAGIVIYIIAMTLTNLVNAMLDPDVTLSIGAWELLFIILDAALYVVIGIIGAFFIHLTARFIFGGQGQLWNYFSCYLFTAVPLVFTALIALIFSPFGLVGLFAGLALIIVGGIWSIVLDVIAIRESYKLTTISSVGVLVVLFIVFIILIFAFISIFMSLF